MKRHLGTIATPCPAGPRAPAHGLILAGIGTDAALAPFLHPYLRSG